MQLSALQRRRENVPAFANHTPRLWEITPVSPSQSPAYCLPSGEGSSFGAHPTGMTIGAGPLYTNAIMGQTPSAEQREKVRKASSTILREDSITRQVEDISGDPYPGDFVSPLPPLSREDSFSIHYDCANQAPYLSATNDAGNDKMMTQNSLLRLPRDNDLHDLAFFLKTTGPTAPHRKPSKLENQPRRAVSAPKNAFRFLRLGSNSRRQVPPVQAAHDRLNGMLRDEGNLLPKNVEQKMSSTGRPYLALVPEVSNEESLQDMVCAESSHHPDILESRVSVCFHHEDTHSSEVFDNWITGFNKHHPVQVDETGPGAEDQRPATSYQEVASRLARRCPTPIRPAASNPPTPEPVSAISMVDSYHTDIVDDSIRRSPVERDQVLPSSPYGAEPQTPKISLPREEFPVKHPSPEKEVEIKHPLPRRLGSHPVLLQRASSIASNLYGGSRSVSDSPGPPPPRSPLRLRRDPRTIESIISKEDLERKSTPKIAPSTGSANNFDFGAQPLRATVTTECTGPIQRPRSRTKDGSPQRRPYPANRREREDRTRARKLRDRPAVNRTINSVAHAPAQATRQKLKKIRPQIQIPDLRPLRAPSTASHVSASSASSWKKVTQSTLTPISPVPSRASEESNDDKTGYTPISPTASAEATAAAQADMCLSPVMLVAEEIPLRKTKSPPKPTKLILKEGKSYAPRPRSASISRTAAKRRSVHNSVHSSPRSKSPDRKREGADAPPLPSPPPTRALPPTPPASGSEKTSKANSKAKVVVKDLPTVPSHDVSPVESSSSGEKRLPHVATQRKPVTQVSRSANRAASRIDARLEALEKQNALLSAALMAVLKTNGALNAPIAGFAEAETQKGPMAWEARVARRSAASHTTASSNGSALEMYMSTRRGSRHGY